MYCWFSCDVIKILKHKQRPPQSWPFNNVQRTSEISLQEKFHVDILLPLTNKTLRFDVIRGSSKHGNSQFHKTDIFALLLNFFGIIIP